MSEGMDYQVSHAGCPNCEPVGDHVPMLMWGMYIAQGNVLFCPECGWEVLQSELPPEMFDGDVCNVDWLKAYLEDVRVKLGKDY